MAQRQARILGGTGVRTPWRRLPARVRAAVEECLGSPVVRARTIRGGFSPGLAADVRAASGLRVFLKAVGPERNPDSPDLHRQEAAIASRLPAAVPAPRLLWSWDEGPGGWVALAFAWLDGAMPRLPWRRSDAWRVLSALDAMAADLTPAPIEGLPPAADAFRASINGWSRLRAEGGEGALTPAFRRGLDTLCALEAAAPAAAEGDTLLNLDVRRDNLILGPAGEVWVVDWPGACRGAAFVEALLFLPSLAMQGGPAPEEALMRSAALRAADPGAVDSVLAAAAGYFTYHALQPPPPGLPTLRAFQAAQGETARAWLGRRLRWL